MAEACAIKGTKSIEEAKMTIDPYTRRARKTQKREIKFCRTVFDLVSRESQ